MITGSAGSNADFTLSGGNGFTLNAGTGNPITINGQTIAIAGSGVLDGDTIIIGTTLNSGTTGFSVLSGNSHNLTLQLTGAVNLGTLTGLNTLLATNSGPFTLGGNISTIGSQTFDGPVTLAAPVTLTSSNAGGILFSGSSATINGNNPLTVSTTGTGGTFGAVTFDGIIGGTAPPTSLTVTGSALLGGNVTTVGAQTFNNSVTLNDAGLPTTFTFLAGASTVSFQGTLDGRTSNSSAVVIGGAGQPSGALFGGNVGGINELSTLTANGNVTIGGNVATTGNQIYLGNVVLTGTSDTLLANFIAPALVKFGGTVDGASALSIGEARLFGTSDAEFDGNAGSHTPLSSLLVTGTTQLGGSVTTIGAQTFTGAVSLAANATLASSGTGTNGDILLGSTVDGTGGLPSLTVSTAGNTTFNGAVGGSPATPDISSVDITNGQTVLSAGISTAGGQTYAGAAMVRANLTLTGTALNASPAAPAVFTGTGTQDLTLDFSNSLNLSLAGSALLGNLDLSNASGALTIPQSISINYPLTVAGPVTLGRNSDPAGTNMALQGPLFAFENTLNDAGGNDNLSITPATGATSGGDLMLGGIVGGTTATDFASIAVAGATTITVPASTTLPGNSYAITTAGGQLYRGSISINQPAPLPSPLENYTTVFTSTGAGIEEDGGITNAVGGVTLQPTSALAAPTSPLGGANNGDFRTNAYLTLNGSISAKGNVSLAFNRLTFNNSTTFTTSTGSVIGVVPDIATIVTSSGGIAVSGQTVKIGPYQKWTSLGSLSISGSKVFLGDMNVAGTLSIASPSISMWLRPAGSLLVTGAAGGSSLGLHTDAAGQEGVDIVADSISMTSTPVGDSAYSTGLAPQFAVGAGGSSTVQPVHDYGTQIFASNLETANSTGSGPAVYYFDLQAKGPATSNVFFTVSPIIPPPAPQISTLSILSESQRSILRAAGINARNTPLADMLDLFGGRAVFNDVPTSDGMVIIHPTLLDYYVTTGRLPYGQTLDFIAMYRRIFLMVKMDPKTHKPVLDKNGKPVYQSRRSELHKLFHNSFAAYEKSVGAAHASAAGYRQWLLHTPSQAMVLDLIKQLRALLRQGRLLGLAPRELQLSSNTILAELNPSALSRRQFEDVVIKGKIR